MSDKELVRKLYIDLCEASINKDLIKLDKILSDDYVLVHMTGMKQTKEDYLDWLIAGLEQLAPHVVVHRLTGDGPKDLLIAPLWSLNKRGVLNAITQALKKKGTWQGKEYHGSTYNSSL